MTQKVEKKIDKEDEPLQTIRRVWKSKSKKREVDRGTTSYRSGVGPGRGFAPL